MKTPISWTMVLPCWACWAYIPCPLGHRNFELFKFCLCILAGLGQAITELPIWGPTKGYGTFFLKKVPYTFSKIPDLKNVC
jgi:hypothetical protein